MLTIKHLYTWLFSRYREPFLLIPDAETEKKEILFEYLINQTANTSTNSINFRAIVQIHIVEENRKKKILSYTICITKDNL